jgi:predicted nucleic acid-binding protein
MVVARFLDTNILLYAISTDPAEHGKRQVARDILATSDWGLSVQVLQEFYVNATRQRMVGGKPFAAPMRAPAAQVAVQEFMRYPLVPTDAALLQEAMRVAERWNTSYWDGAIIAAAHRLSAAELWSEDLNAGQDYGGVVVVNPFAP